MSPRIVALADAGGIGAGGKAEGLARLLALGLDVPAGFVLLGASEASHLPELDEAYRAIGGGRVAVRSSAADEDGASASFAGQHETILGVDGLDALRDAVHRCLASLRSEHASAYRASRTGASGASMSVVVQRMVEARAAGVVFSVDPVSARRDRVMVDAVRGLGDALVSGQVTPDHHLVARDGTIVERHRAGEADVLDDATVASITRRAVELERAFGRPIDAEWAIDPDGTLRWLQARPITVLPADPRELDSPVMPAHVLTKCNVGEMMPGAATPLTWSTSARGIDYGMQRLYAEIGVLPRVEPAPIYVKQWFGHLFIDLSEMRAIGGGVAGASEEDVVAAICGRVVPEVGKARRLPWLRRALNGARYGRALASHARRIAALDRILASLAFEGETAAARYAALDRQLPLLLDAYYHHLVASMLAGAVASALLKTLAKGEPPGEAHHARVAELLAGAEGVESHDIAVGIDRIVERILSDDPARGDALVGRDGAGALRWLRDEAPAPVRAAFDAYLARHGHRCVREVEMREREWSADPSPIVDSIVAGVRTARLGRRVRHRPPAPEVPRALRPFVTLGHVGVRARESAKSKLVAVSSRFKAAYRALADALVVEGRLPDADLVFFLTHDELGALVRHGGETWIEHARARREVLPIQMAMVFPEIFLGAPEPSAPEPPSGDKILRGKPVSRGRVRGRARVALTLAEARAVEPGEILIAPITDVGWTPCFATIAGLATDIGSAVSHGAVVAREYGLPALVDVRVGTTTFATGDYVELDADGGVLRAIDPP